MPHTSYPRNLFGYTHRVMREYTVYLNNLNLKSVTGLYLVAEAIQVDLELKFLFVNIGAKKHL